jgi:hypothetical protein
MNRFYFTSLIVLCFSNLFSQNNLVFKGYFSYNQINAISQSSNKVVVASENALFSKDLSNNEIKTFNTIDGLSGETISTIYFSAALNKTIIGYQNGLIITINEADKSIFKAVGIIKKQIPENVKKINSFYEKDGIIYASCLFGIVQFNLNNNLFGDTYFLGATTSDYQEVIQTTILNNSIYAVTRNNGIKKAEINNPNLNDYNQWQVFDSGSWNGIANLNNQIIASNSNNLLYKFIGPTSSTFFSQTAKTKDFRVVDNRLIVTNEAIINIFNDLLSPVLQINSSSINSIPPVFTNATIVNNNIYIGTLENGLYETSINNSNSFINITPNCPLRNAIFAMNASSSVLWASYGGFSNDFNPYAYNPLQPNNFNNVNKYGVSKFDDNGWTNTPFSNLLDATAITSINVNPKDPNQVYFSSFHSGLLKTNNAIPTILYNQTNSLLSSVEDVGPPYVSIRINGTAFDKNGNLWVTNTRAKKAIKVLKPDNTWQAISIEPISSQYAANSYGNIVIDKNNTKWIASSFDGVIAYNENGNVLKKITSGPNSGNLPTFTTRVVALDNKNQLWIGTLTGLRIIPNIDTFLSPGQINTTNIVINENGIGQELFYEQNIKDIVVDGANRKWVGTADSGVFLVSPNGQQTIYHFTPENSPLPSNLILDIDIDPKTGEVYIATDKGMISFRGTATKASENLDNVYVYPNPVRPDYLDTVKVSGLLDKATVKITDIEGSLVFEATSEGGTIEWDTTAFGKYKVATGVYMVFISAKDGEETKVNKIMIIR